MPIDRLILAFVLLLLVRKISLFVATKMAIVVNRIVATRRGPDFVRWVAHSVSWCVVVYGAALVLQRFVHPTFASISLAITPLVAYVLLFEHDRRTGVAWDFSVRSKLLGFVLSLLAFTVIAVFDFQFPDPFGAAGWKWSPR